MLGTGLLVLSGGDPVVATLTAGDLLAAFAYDLVNRPRAAEAATAAPPQGAAGDIKGREVPLR